MTSNRLFFLCIILIGCLAKISSDIYAPSIPSIALDLKTSLHHVQASMVIFMLGGISQLFYGPISDVVGRKKPLLIGLFIFLLGNMISLYAVNIHALNIGRFIQGMGVGAAASLWRSMFRDRYTGAEMAKYTSYLLVSISFVMPAAPLLGGYLDELFNWRASFVFMIIYAVIAMMLIIGFVSESHDRKTAHQFSPKLMAKNYLTLLKSRVFLGYALCAFLAAGAFFSWFLIGPILLIHYLHYSPSYFGWVTFLGGGLAISLSGFLNGQYVKQWGVLRMLQLGWSVMGVAGLLLLGGYYLMGLNQYGIMIPVIIFYFGVMFIFPNTFSRAFAPFGHMAGTAAALYSTLQASGIVIIGFIVALLPDNNQVPLAIIMMISPLLSWCIYRFYIREIRVRER